jgi:NADP-dependent 3-hydroxy acid dehydrogenase YdfG
MTAIAIAPGPAAPGLLEGRVALIFGASHGIGAAAARVFAAAGARVVLAAWDEAAIGSLAGELEADDHEAWPVATDVTSAAAVERAVWQAGGEPLRPAGRRVQ